MITELSPLLHRVSTQVKPEDLLLKKGSWVYFTEGWKKAAWEWAGGKLFEVSEEPLLVRYAKSYILPENDWTEIDLSNSEGGLKLYPTEVGVLYQCAVGFKPGNYIVHIYVPKEVYVFGLGHSSMYPNPNDSDLKYLGAKTPEDSPADAPTLFFYFIKDAPAVYLKPVVLEGTGFGFEKVTVVFHINKCKLKEIPKSAEYYEGMKARALRIAHCDEYERI